MTLTQPRCIGLDLSLSSTGMSCLHFVHGETYRAEIARVQPKKLDGPRRIVYIRDAVLEFVEAQRPDVISIEHYAFGAKNQAHQLGELGGVVRVALHEYGYGYYDCAPGVLKKFVTGKGNAPKDVVIKGVYKQWGFDTDSNDVADAYSLSWISRALLLKNVKTKGMSVRQVNKLLAILSVEPGA